MKSASDRSREGHPLLPWGRFGGGDGLHLHLRLDSDRPRAQPKLLQMRGPSMIRVENLFRNLSKRELGGPNLAWRLPEHPQRGVCFNHGAVGNGKEYATEYSGLS